MSYRSERELSSDPEKFRTFYLGYQPISVKFLKYVGGCLCCLAQPVSVGRFSGQISGSNSKVSLEYFSSFISCRRGELPNGVTVRPAWQGSLKTSSGLEVSEYTSR